MSHLPQFQVFSPSGLWDLLKRIVWRGSFNLTPPCRIWEPCPRNPVGLSSRVHGETNASFYGTPENLCRAYIRGLGTPTIRNPFTFFLGRSKVPRSRWLPPKKFVSSWMGSLGPKIVGKLRRRPRYRSLLHRENLHNWVWLGLAQLHRALPRKLSPLTAQGIPRRVSRPENPSGAKQGFARSLGRSTLKRSCGGGSVKGQLRRTLWGLVAGEPETGRRKRRRKRCPECCAMRLVPWSAQYPRKGGSDGEICWATPGAGITERTCSSGESPTIAKTGSWRSKTLKGYGLLLHGAGTPLPGWRGRHGKLATMTPRKFWCTAHIANACPPSKSRGSSAWAETYTCRTRRSTPAAGGRTSRSRSWLTPEPHKGRAASSGRRATLCGSPHNLSPTGRYWGTRLGTICSRPRVAPAARRKRKEAFGSRSKSCGWIKKTPTYLWRLPTLWRRWRRRCPRPQLTYQSAATWKLIQRPSRSKFVMAPESPQTRRAKEKLKSATGMPVQVTRRKLSRRWQPRLASRRTCRRRWRLKKRRPSHALVGRSCSWDQPRYSCYKQWGMLTRRTGPLFNSASSPTTPVGMTSRACWNGWSNWPIWGKRAERVPSRRSKPSGTELGGSLELRTCTGKGWIKRWQGSRRTTLWVLEWENLW